MTEGHQNGFRLCRRHGRCDHGTCRGDSRGRHRSDRSDRGADADGRKLSLEGRVFVRERLQRSRVRGWSLLVGRGRIGSRGCGLGRFDLARTTVAAGGLLLGGVGRRGRDVRSHALVCGIGAVGAEDQAGDDRQGSKQILHGLLLGLT